jgi:hypothetical protein
MADDKGGFAERAFSIGAEDRDPEAVFINDAQFISDLKRLKQLRSFLIQEAINVSAEDSRYLSFGSLNLLRFRLEGRAPTEEEWVTVELHTQSLFGLLNEPLRRRFILGEIPGWISILPLGLAAAAIAALIGAILSQERALFGFKTVGANTLPFYVIWLICLGAIGAVAFIGMNALSVQQDVTFDLSNRRLMVLRIALGALFGLVLSLPFGFRGFSEFLLVITGDSNPSVGGARATTEFTTQALALLLPFILGFSTSLVIMILNRLVDAVQAFFGKMSPSERSQVQTVSAPTASSSARATAREQLSASRT